MITGVSSGIGKALTAHYVSRGERVIGIARNPGLLEALNNSLEIPDGAPAPEFITCDFASFASMRDARDRLKVACADGLDTLINNAAIVPHKKILTEDGFELQYQVNHLAVAYFSLELLDELTKAEGTVITTGSNAHKWARFHPRDIAIETRYHALSAYMRTKLYNLLFAASCRRHFSHLPIAHYVVHPGRVKTAIGTKGVSRFYGWVWRRFTRHGLTPEATIPTFDYLTYATPGPGGLYFFNVEEHPSSKAARSKENQDILFERTLFDLAPYRA